MTEAFSEVLTWGEDGQWIVVGGHIDEMTFFSLAGPLADDYGFELDDFTEEDVVHAFATPRPRPGYDDWFAFHLEPENHSIEITVLALDGEPLPAHPAPEPVIESEPESEPRKTRAEGLADRLISETIQGDFS